jgi:hypothetical protein
MKSLLHRARAVGLALLVVGSVSFTGRIAMAQSENPRDAAKEDSPTHQSDHFLKELYFYLPFGIEPLQHLFDPDSIVKNATTNFPAVDAMSGIALNIYWSQLCPVEGQCNFSIIDRVLDFWRKAGRKVILSVAVIGPPLEKFIGSEKAFVSATPDWLLKAVSTFQSASNNFIGIFNDWRNMASNPLFSFPFPRYDDPRFVAEIEKLVRQLGERYDGNPTISYVRIGAGKAGEDNPIGRTNGFGLGTGMPGFTNHLWISYSRRVADAYFASFHKSRLEFDMGWMAVVAAGAKNITPITMSEQAQAEDFLDYVMSKDVFMTFDGGPAATNSVPGATAANPQGVTCTGFSPRPDATTPPIVAAPYAEVEHWRRLGMPFGFEVAALSNPCDAPEMIRAILERYRPRRIIFFADWAALINFHHKGLNQQNKWEVDAMTNVFVPWTNAAEFPAHEAQAMPKIKQFADELDDLVEQILARERDRASRERPD